MTDDSFEPAEDDNVTSLDVARHRAASLAFLENSPGLPVRAKPGQKDPHKGWDPKNATEAQKEAIIAALRACDDNIGVHLLGSLVDVDVDTDDAWMMAALDLFLPRTGHVWGHGERLKTHRLYTLRDDFHPQGHPVLNRLKKITQVKTEVRGGPKERGHYSLMPGSLHPSGEYYEWASLDAAASSPALVDLPVLLRAVRFAAAAAILAPYWIEGQRNELSAALSGFFARLYTTNQQLYGEDDETDAFLVSEIHAMSFLEHFLDLVDDDPKDRYSRVKTFERTWAKHDAGGIVTGAKRIGELTGNEELPRLLYSVLSDNTSLSKVEELLERFIVHIPSATGVDTHSFDAEYDALVMLTREKLRNSFGHVNITIGDGRRMNVSDLLFVHPNTVRVYGFGFDPDKPRLYERKPDSLAVNLWSGWGVEPHDGSVSDDDVRPFLDYLSEVVGGGDPIAYSWVLNWVASIFREPTNKPGTALVLVGKPGVGKSFLGHSILNPIIGRRHAAVTNSVNAITDRFNSMFGRKLLIQCDEAIHSGQKVTANKLKSIVTDPVITVEQKGIDAIQMPNYARLLFTSNEEENALDIHDGADDRRYTVLKVPGVRLRNIEYWRGFAAWCNPENLAKVHRWLRDWDGYDASVPKAPYVTDAKRTITQMTRQTFDKWLAAWVARGHPLARMEHWYEATSDEALEAYKETGDVPDINQGDWPQWIRMSALVRDFAEFLRKHARRDEHPLNEQQIKKHLSNRGLEIGATKRIAVKQWDQRIEQMRTDKPRLHEMPKRQQVLEYLAEAWGDENDTETDELPTNPGGARAIPTREEEEY
jgi:hypothetical protein